MCFLGAWALVCHHNHPFPQLEHSHSYLLCRDGIEHLSKYNEMHGIEVAQSDVLSIPPMAHYRCVVTCSPIRGPTTLSGLRLVYQMISSNIQIAPKFYGTHLARGLAPASIQVSSFQQPCTTLVVIYICI
jgi:hypothetical protein